MLAIFNSWESLNRVVNNENTVWGKKLELCEEILVYEAPSGQLILTDEPIDDPNYTEIEW